MAGMQGYTKALRAIRFVRLIRVLRMARLLKKIAEQLNNRVLFPWYEPYRYHHSSETKLVTLIRMLQVAIDVGKMAHKSRIAALFSQIKSSWQNKTLQQHFDSNTDNDGYLV